MNLICLDVETTGIVANLERSPGVIFLESDYGNVIDVINFVRWHERAYRKRTLEAMCARLGIEIGTAHDAGDDAAATLKVLDHYVRKHYGGDIGAAKDHHDEIAPKIRDEFDAWTYWLYRSRDVFDVICMGAGKHCGSPLDSVPADYLHFCLTKMADLPPAVRDEFTASIKRR